MKILLQKIEEEKTLVEINNLFLGLLIEKKEFLIIRLSP